MIGGNFYIVLMVVGPLVGVFGTIATQIFSARLQKRTTSGTVATSNASELWAENSRLVDRLGKEIDRLTADVDHVREELRRIRQERDNALGEAAAMKERVHELELELLRLKHGQAAAAVQTPTKVTVETPGPVTVNPTPAPGGSD